MRRTPGAACLLILLILLAASSLNGQTQPRMWVTGYYPVWAVTDMPARDVNWSGMTHVVHFPQSSLQTVAPYWSPCVRNAQGLQDSLDLVRGGGWVYPHNSQDIPDSLRRYARNAGVKVLLSVGGIYGSGAAALDYITQDSARCYVFVESAVRFAQRHRYDGIEIDWEPPASRDQMSRLTRMTKRAMSRLLGPQAELVLAVANGSTGTYDLSLKDSIAQYNMMMYDMHFTPAYATNNGGSTDVTGHNSPISSPSQTTSQTLYDHNWNYDGVYSLFPGSPRQLYTGPRRWIADGMPASKIAIGVPFYGYCYRGKNAPGQPRNGVWPQYIPYQMIRRGLENGGRYHWDEGGRVPWVGGTATAAISWYVNPGEQFYITFDDSASIVEKVRWARQLGLGGIMIYELWQGWIPAELPGRKDPLLRALVREVGNPLVTPPSGSLTVEPSVLPAGGGQVRLMWSSTRALGAVLEPGVGQVPTSGSRTITVTGSTVFSLLLTGEEGTSASYEVGVEVQPPIPGGGSDITERGTIVSLVTAPRGSGNGNPEVIRDGVIPPPGSTNSGDQFDTYTDGSARQEDWIGYTFDEPMNIGGLRFQEGVEFQDGGWFESIRAQIRVDGAWQDAPGFKVSPPYAGRNGVGFEVYDLSFDKVRATGVRIIGLPGGASHFISVGELRVLTENPRPADYVLEQNYPNPFNPSTRIHYKLPAEAYVRLSVYNVLGEQIATLVDALQPAGSYITEFDGKGLSAGVYLAVLRANDYVEVRKMVLLK